MTRVDKNRIQELESTLEWKEKVFQRFVEMKVDNRSKFFRGIKLHRAKIRPLVNELEELLSISEPEHA